MKKIIAPLVSANEDIARVVEVSIVKNQYWVVEVGMASRK